MEETEVKASILQDYFGQSANFYFEQFLKVYDNENVDYFASQFEIKAYIVFLINKFLIMKGYNQQSRVELYNFFKSCVLAEYGLFDDNNETQVILDYRLKKYEDIMYSNEDYDTKEDKVDNMLLNYLKSGLFTETFDKEYPIIIEDVFESLVLQKKWNSLAAQVEGIIFDTIKRLINNTQNILSLSSSEIQKRLLEN